MSLRTRLATALTLVAVLLSSSPAVSAHDFRPDYGNGGVIATPLSAKGRFIFVTRVSRRVLWKMVAQNQQPYRPQTLRVQL